MAGAIVGEPEILILDEPTVGLDPKQITEIRQLIKNLGKNHTVIFSSHILSEVSQICEKVVIINEGKIVAIDTPENLEFKTNTSNSLTVVVEDRDDKIVLIALTDFPQNEALKVIMTDAEQ
jgi:ABC-2 type transport system ATP-binding protein